MDSHRSGLADRRRFRVKHALRAVDDAIALLDPAPADGVDIPALQRVREDLEVVLREAEANR